MASAHCCALAFLLTSTAGAQQPIRGFPSDVLGQRGQLEAALRATPDTARLREYLAFMSAQPHHAGSPRGRAVAEYAPGFYTGYGVKTMPGIREAVEQKNLDEARAQAAESRPRSIAWPRAPTGLREPCWLSTDKELNRA